MKTKAAILSIMLLTVSLSTGCATWLNPQIDGSAAYHTGRDITVVYLLGKDELDEKHIKAVNEVYKVFTEIMVVIETANLDEFKDEVKAQLRKRLEDDKAYAVSIHLLNTYWNRLVGQVDWETLQKDKRIKALQELQRGIEDSLTEYDFLR